MNEPEGKAWILEKLKDKSLNQKEFLKLIMEDRKKGIILSGMSANSLRKYLKSLAIVEKKIVIWYEPQETGRDKKIYGLRANFIRDGNLRVGSSNVSVDDEVLINSLSENAQERLKDLMKISEITSAKDVIEKCLVAVDDIQYDIRCLAKDKQSYSGDEENKVKNILLDHLDTLECVASYVTIFTDDTPALSPLNDCEKCLSLEKFFEICGKCPIFK